MIELDEIIDAGLDCEPKGNVKDNYAYHMSVGADKGVVNDQRR